MPESVTDQPIYKSRKQNVASTGELVAASYDGYELIEKYKNRFEQLKDIRKPMENKWSHVRDLLLPSDSRWLGGSDDSDDAVIDDSRIRDTMPRKMIQTAADGLHGGLSNPSTDFFSFYIGRYDSFDTDASKDTKLYLKLASECVRDVLANSNTYPILKNIYLETLGFGCALMVIYPDADDYVRVYHHTAGTYWVAQNSRRMIDTVYIKFRLSAIDIANDYGRDRCPDKVIEAIDNRRGSDKFTVIQCIQPWNFFGDLQGSHPDFVYEDVRFLEESEDSDQVLYRSGYRSKPFIFSRWTESGDFVYPRSCPGIDALPDIRQLYEATEDFTNAVAWTTNPAFFYDRALDQDIQGLKPGDLIAVSASNQRVPIQAVIPPVFNFDANIAFRSGLIEKISSIFYNREIMMVSSRAEQGHVMTATEANLLRQETNAVLGPITTRTSYDILIPMLDRVYEIIQSTWAILDQPPEELIGEDIKPYFTSEMAITQRQAWIQRANLVLEWLNVAAQFSPGILNSFNFDNWAREFERTDFISPFLLNTKEEVAQLNQQQAEAQQQQAQMEQLSEVARAGKNLGATPTTGDNAAAQLLEGGGAGMLGGGGA